MKPTALFTAIALAFPIAASAAAVVYRCDVDGKVIYADRPCKKDAKPVKIDANSVTEVDQSSLAAKRKALDARINARIEVDAAERDLDRAKRDRWRSQCSGYVDEYRRQGAWLNSISPAVGANAAIEMQVQRRKWEEANCGRQADRPLKY